MIGIIVEGLVIGFAVHQSLTKSLKEKQKTEELLIAHSQFLSVGRELAAIVHQWRMPLYRMSTIAMYLESLLLKKSVSTAKLAPSIEYLNQTISFMDETITSFHNFYRREDVQKEFNVYEKIEKIVDMLKPLLQSHCIEVKNRCDKEMLLHAKSDIFGHIVLILLQNAIAALSVSSHETREISLSNFMTLTQIGICVKDNGGGIELSKLPHLFSKTVRSENGLGFGLQLAHFLVYKELGGEIQAYNSDKGAVFEVLMLKQHM